MNQKSDTPYGARTPGPVATNMNIIRSELNAQGGNYGQRQTYLAYPSGGDAIMPFNFMSDSVLSNSGSVYPTLPGGIIQHQYISFPRDRNHFNYLVRKFSGDKYVKFFTCWNQLLTLMFGQLSNRESLRDLIVALQAHQKKLTT